MLTDRLSPSATATGASGAAAEAKDGARKAKDSESFAWLVRLGLVAYGVVHLLIGWLAIQLALGDSEGSADKGGALQQLTETPLGSPLLWVLVLGFVALVIWQLAEAAIGHEDEDDATKRTGKRALSVAKAVIYGFLAVSSAKIATGGSGGGGNSSEETMTAKLMDAPLGQGLVGLVGVAILGLGIGLVWYGWEEKFTKHLSGSGQTIVLLGKIGYIAKGIAFSVLGVLFVIAAVEHDPKKGGGLDDALKTMLDQPYGPVLVVAVGLGIAAYGLYCFARARDLRSA